MVSAFFSSLTIGNTFLMFDIACWTDCRTPGAHCTHTHSHIVTTVLGFGLVRPTGGLLWSPDCWQPQWHQSPSSRPQRTQTRCSTQDPPEVGPGCSDDCQRYIWTRAQTSTCNTRTGSCSRSHRLWSSRLWPSPQSSSRSSGPWTPGCICNAEKMSAAHIHILYNWTQERITGYEQQVKQGWTTGLYSLGGLDIPKTEPRVCGRTDQLIGRGKLDITDRLEMTKEDAQRSFGLSEIVVVDTMVSTAESELESVLGTELDTTDVRLGF